MSRWLTPLRARGVEVLDLHDTSDDVRLAAMHDVERSNALFGGVRAVQREVRSLLSRLPAPLAVLDVGTGTGDIAWRVRPTLAAHAPFMAGLDRSRALLAVARVRLHGAVAGDALSLPFRDASLDLVLCSQLLHHFAGDDAARLVAELHRVSRGFVVISDLRRSRVAAAGFRAAGAMLRFHPVTVADGVTSIYRGFTAHELRELIERVTGVTPRVRRGLFWRLVATWDAREYRISSP